MGNLSTVNFRFRPMIFIYASIFFLVFSLFVCPVPGFGIEINPAQLNTWYDIRTPDTPVNWSTMPKMFQTIVRKVEPYVAIYRFQLGKGKKYTFQSEYPADHFQGQACLRGVNPLAASKYYSAPSGTAGLILCHNRSFPGGNIKGHVFGRKSNFTTSVKSQHNSDYLVITSKNPNTPFRFRMIEPAEKDDFIRKKGGYRIRPGQDTFYSWSNVHTKELWMGYAQGEKKDPQVDKKKTTNPVMSTSSGIKVFSGNKAVAKGEKISIHFSGLPGNKKDWMTIVKKGASANNYGQFFYTNGKKEGVFNFKGLEPGQYEIRGHNS